ncbi:MAG: hypothetical protein FI731_04250 [SAR202 cluster bacterium]|nr:hypothetical protein [SAR202 cluster bacterium]
MSWIEEVPVDVPPVISCMSINKPAMEAVRALNAAVTFGASALTRFQEECIATTVANANRCRY